MYAIQWITFMEEITTKWHCKHVSLSISVVNCAWASRATSMCGYRQTE